MRPATLFLLFFALPFYALTAQPLIPPGQEVTIIVEEVYAKWGEPTEYRGYLANPSPPVDPPTDPPAEPPTLEIQVRGGQTKSLPANGIVKVRVNLDPGSNPPEPKNTREEWTLVYAAFDEKKPEVALQVTLVGEDRQFKLIAVTRDGGTWESPPLDRIKQDLKAKVPNLSLTFTLRESEWTLDGYPTPLSLPLGGMRGKFRVGSKAGKIEKAFWPGAVLTVGITREGGDDITNTLLADLMAIENPNRQKRVSGDPGGSIHPAFEAFTLSALDGPWSVILGDRRAMANGVTFAQQVELLAQLILNQEPEGLYSSLLAIRNVQARPKFTIEEARARAGIPEGRGEWIYGTPYIPPGMPCEYRRIINRDGLCAIRTRLFNALDSLGRLEWEDLPPNIPGVGYCLGVLAANGATFDERGADNFFSCLTAFADRGSEDEVMRAVRGWEFRTFAPR